MERDALDLVVVWNWYRHCLVREAERRNPPIVWMKDYLRKRREHGAFWTLLNELCDPRSLGHAAEFKRFTRIDLPLFEEILNAIGPLIHRQDTNYRECVTPGERLAITLRFLATGDSYPSLHALFRVSVSTICKLIPWDLPSVGWNIHRWAHCRTKHREGMEASSKPLCGALEFPSRHRGRWR